MPDKAQPKHLDTRELIAPGLVIKYHSGRKPDDATKRFLRSSTSIARSVMRSTVWEVDKIVLFHRDEPDWMTETLDKHFCLNRDPALASTKDAKGKLVNAKARRKYLSGVRKVMLSISFHLNTGAYLLDVDAGHRMSVGDFAIDNLGAGWQEQNPAGANVVSRNIEGYVQKRDGLMKTLGGSSSGGIHVGFSLGSAFGYSPERMARIIIHEATHKYCYTDDVKYCHDPNYDVESPVTMAKNADSFAYAAMSIGAKEMLDYNGLIGYSYT
ncbi:MAG TPA: hypothetical protein VFH71_07170 [Rhodanobacteraceae bacterium]|nr:hypothetical protein [Rhodanobacteraceae bacterium]